MNTLYLTKEEKTAFGALPDGLRDGWQVADERDIPADAPAKLQMRLQLMRLQSPVLKSAAQSFAPGATPESLQQLFAATTLKDVSDADLAELTFAMGSAGLTKVIQATFPLVRTDSEMEQLAALTTIRHQLLS